jgi:cytochrome c-type biogenesis protein CcmH/NrfG
MSARQALLNGEFAHAVGITTQLVQQNLFINEIIQDLQDAVYRNSSETVLWEALGDAYVRKDLLQEALDAYLHAEELLS